MKFYAVFPWLLVMLIIAALNFAVITSLYIAAVAKILVPIASVVLALWVSWVVFGGPRAAPKRSK